MNLDLTAQKVRLSWKDILWGYENKYLGWADVAAYARKMTLSDHDERVFKLSLTNKSNIFELKPVLEDLASETRGYSPKNWLYILLNDVFHRKEEFDDPLGEVEKIYADFDYPEEIESFVRYMPPKDGYIPSNHSYEENIARLYSHWEHYLNNGGGQG
ncbi:TPA: DUF2247 family protein [Neisseria gonorrhoeae]